MEWVNTKNRLKAVALACGVSALPLGIVFFTITSFMDVPKDMPTADLCEPTYGQHVLAEYKSAKMDDFLKDNSRYLHLHDAICLRKLKNGDRLVRIVLANKSEPWSKLLNKLSGNETLFYWREAGQNKDYRAIYAGRPVDENETAVAFLQRNGLNNLGIKMIVEAINYDSGHGEFLTMTFDPSWITNQ